jgi:hypothetical protein
MNGRSNPAARFPGVCCEFVAEDLREVFFLARDDGEAHGAEIECDCDDAGWNREDCDGGQWQQEGEIDGIAGKFEDACGCQFHWRSKGCCGGFEAHMTLNDEDDDDKGKVAGDEQCSLIEAVKQTGWAREEDAQGETSTADPSREIYAQGDGQAFCHWVSVCAIVIGWQVESCH